METEGREEEIFIEHFRTNAPTSKQAKRTAKTQVMIHGAQAEKALRHKREKYSFFRAQIQSFTRAGYAASGQTHKAVTTRSRV